MKLVAVMKLEPTEEQRKALLATVERINAACNWLAKLAFALQCHSKYKLQSRFYTELRERFSLSSQMAVRAIAKVCEAYKRDLSICPTFRAHGAVSYDARILSPSQKEPNTVSILTLEGREQIAFVAGGPHAERLKLVWGQADLVLRKRKWFLFVSVEVPSPDALLNEPREGWLGVDLGIVNLVTDSDGHLYCGATVEAVRARSHERRRILQQVGTRSSRRALKRLSGKEARFRADTNHCLSKTLVRYAKDTQRGIALEDLQGIREGNRFAKKASQSTDVARVVAVSNERDSVGHSGLRSGSKAQRNRVGGWAFAQLRAFIQYKAMHLGVPSRVVDPRNTSRTCPECGSCDARNRPSQAQFRCTACAFEQHADVVAARNIATIAQFSSFVERAAVNRPMVSHADAVNAETANRVPPLSAETSYGL